MRRYALRDDQWDRIKDILPGREGIQFITPACEKRFEMSIGKLIEKSAIATKAYWLRVYRSCPNFAQ